MSGDRAAGEPVSSEEPSARRRHRILVIAPGSAGDTHPVAALAVTLRDRGHDIRFVAYHQFETLAQKLGLDFVPLGSVDDELRTSRQPSFRQRGIRTVTRNLRPLYDIILRESQPGNTVLVGSVNTFAARLARETPGIPLVNINLQPAVYRSEYDAPGLPVSDVPGFPEDLARVVRRAQFNAAYWCKWDRVFGPPLNEFRRDLGLGPVRHPFQQWVHSPDLNIGLFPSWYAKAEPDWPPNTELTAFPRLDLDALADIDPEVEEFLDAGEAPVVFTHGSEFRFAHYFFEAAVKVCRAAGYRGILLTKFREQLPEPLPDEVRHFDFIPLGHLLPRARAIVHHGGIGTSALSLAAGIPQVVVPRRHDQPDNAGRLKRLGVAALMSPRACRPIPLQRALERVLDSDEVRENCRLWAPKVHETDPMPEACRLIEQLADRN